MTTAPDFALCTQRRDSMRAYALKLSHDPDVANDVVQNAMLCAWRAWPKFVAPSVGDVGQAVNAWLSRIVHHEFISHLRREASHSRLLVEVHCDRTVEDPYATRARLEINADTSTADVDAKIAELPARQRDVVNMRAKGREYREIATTLGIPLGSVMSALHRARAALRASLRFGCEA